MLSELTLILNDTILHPVSNSSSTLLDFIRKEKHLTGTKEVCKEGDCGACAVLIGEIKNNRLQYNVINSCLFPLKKANGKHVVTIEGLNQENLNRIQEIFHDQFASQCGFCTPGFIISLTAYLLNTNKYNPEKAIEHISGNICRCTGYHSIIRSVESIGNDLGSITLKDLVEKNFLPKYFLFIREKLKQLNHYHQNNKLKKGVIVGGGTDLYVQTPDKLEDSQISVTDSFIEKNIFIKNKEIVISGSATINDFEEFLLKKNIGINLDKLFKLFASRPIKNSATIAGNIVNASPIGDLTITLMALNSKLELEDSKGVRRKLFIYNFYKGYKKLNKKKREVIRYITFPIKERNTYFNFEKVSKRTHLDIASVNSAIKLTVKNNIIKGASISAGGVSPIPLYLKKTSEYLVRKNISEDTILDAIEIAKNEISPISDIRGSKEYKQLLLSQLIKAHFFELFPKKLTGKFLYG